MRFVKYYEYDVYEDGSIYSHICNRFLKFTPNYYGYLATTIYPNGKMRRVRIHRLVAELFIGPPPAGKNMINHKDGNKLNNHYSNLEWCNAYENNKHARDTGLNNISEANRKRYLDPEFRKRQGQRMSETKLRLGSSKGENNGRFRYRIHGPDNKIFTRQELTVLLGRSQANIDVMIRNAANGKIHKLFEMNGLWVEDISKSQSTIENDNK